VTEVPIAAPTTVELLQQILENQRLAKEERAQITARLDRMEKAKAEMPPQGYFKIKQAMAYTRLSDDHIRRAVTSGRLPVSNIGTPNRPLYLISKADIDAWMEKQKAGPQPRPARKNGQPEVRKLPPSRHYASPPAA
jgi:excisionase family DNA binding protein